MKYLKNENILIIIIIYVFVIAKLFVEDNVLYSNILNPIFWFTVLIYLWWDIKTSYIRFNKNKKYIINMIIISSAYIIAYFYMGFIFGFVKSPYNHETLTIIQNILVTIIPIIGIEVTRYVVATRNKNSKLLLIFLTILLILAEINYNTAISLYENKEEFFKYICSSLLPIIATGALYTYLTLKGSYLLVLIYRLYKELTIMLLPILPDMDWFIKGCLCILSPTLVYVLFEYKFTKERKENVKFKNKSYAQISYIVTFVILITLICFMLGLFKYEPITILSNSMLPTFNRGDVVIFKKISKSNIEELPENSIIVYGIEDQNVAHRVVKKIKENDMVLYQTKGDNNNVVDADLVQINQIKGVYVFHIKYIGFPSVWLYSYFNHENSKVETK